MHPSVMLVSLGISHNVMMPPIETIFAEKREDYRCKLLLAKQIQL